MACQRGSRQLFSGIALRVAPGQCWLVSGPNGSGKTSLLRILANLAEPARGRLVWRGRPVAGNDRDFRQHVIYAGHAAGLSEGLTVQENLDFLLLQDRTQPDAQARAQALRTVHLGAQRHLTVRQLSAGQRRRVFLARLALSARPLWILDEQLTALDLESQALLGQLVERHLQGGGGVVMTSHQALPWRLDMQHLQLGPAC